jgi:uncharacterized protein YbjT (DUF2867 family)
MSNAQITVAVDGATGYVGSHLVYELRQRGVNVNAIVHQAANDSDCKFLESCGANLYKTALDANSNELQKALKGADYAVHLIGSIAPPKGQKLEDLHKGQTTQLVESCKKSGTKIIMVTALGSAADADSVYHRTKWQAEEVVRQSGLPYLILRPSLIIGRKVGRRDSKLMARYIKLLEEKAKIPVIAGGTNRVQPVFVVDLAKAISNAIIEGTAQNSTVEIGGAEAISMKDLLGLLMDTTGKHKPLQAIPAGLANILATVLEAVQNVPLLSRDQVKLSQKDNVCQNNALESLLHSKPESIQSALATYKEPAARAVV